MKSLAACLFKIRRKISSKEYLDGEIVLRIFIKIFEFVDSICPEPKVTACIRQKPESMELL